MNRKKINLLVLIGIVAVIASAMTASADDPLDPDSTVVETDGGDDPVIVPNPDDPTDDVMITSDPDSEDEPADDEIILGEENTDDNGDLLISPEPEDDSDTSPLGDERKSILDDETASNGKSFKAEGLPLYGGLAAIALLLPALIVLWRRL